jgi:hypothetical protein
MQNTIHVIKILFEPSCWAEFWGKKFPNCDSLYSRGISNSKNFCGSLYRRWKNEINSKKYYIVKSAPRRWFILRLGVEGEEQNPKEKVNTRLYSSHYTRFSLVVVVFMYVIDSYFHLYLIEVVCETMDLKNYFEGTKWSRSHTWSLIIEWVMHEFAEQNGHIFWELLHILSAITFLVAKWGPHCWHGCHISFFGALPTWAISHSLGHLPTSWFTSIHLLP